MTEYSEAEENAVIIVLHDGETVDPETSQNRLSAAIIRNAVSAAECSTAADKQIILKLKQD